MTTMKRHDRSYRNLDNSQRRKLSRMQSGALSGRFVSTAQDGHKGDETRVYDCILREKKMKRDESGVFSAHPGRVWILSIG